MDKIPGPFHPAMEDEAGRCSLVLVRSVGDERETAGDQQKGLARLLFSLCTRCHSSASLFHFPINCFLPGPSRPKPTD